MSENGKTEVDIDKVEADLDEKRLIELFKKNSKKAEELIEDEDKMEHFLQKIEKKLKTVPIAGSALAYVPLMISLARSYVRREYDDAPITSILAIFMALLYFASPIDFIPDAIPVVGYVDDAVIISGCIALIKTDLEDYRKWRKYIGMELEDAPDYEEIEREAKKYNKLLSAFYKGRETAS